MPNQLALLSRLSRWVVVAAVCLSLGLQWTMLQGIAWTGMLITFASEGSLMEAVSKTFDGEHPCPLCKAVEAGQKHDQQKSADAPKKKMEAILVFAIQTVAPASKIEAFPQFIQQGERRAMMPPRQPPRFA
ncbi:hypothetical protein SAMN02745166_01232 [Prosthecobacter debontii]|uniref:Uncharacterized protein n=1 Tax=Prosthecobacter debontii TaxID=48467 RepID=A0A1T4X8Q9_9BACT|nr:hypothetical protein [Prosthecobacter debontii]SKA85992.1 hypothetical protein SAMN02745166_01232 [Prosthecobacter debontii]